MDVDEEIAQLEARIAYLKRKLPLNEFILDHEIPYDKDNYIEIAEDAQRRCSDKKFVRVAKKYIQAHDDFSEAFKTALDEALKEQAENTFIDK